MRSPKEDVVLSQPQSGELHLIYTGGCPPRAGRVRRLPLSARKVEVGALRFPQQRSRIKTSKRESFNTLGEETNFQGTFSGVSFRPLNELPMISTDEKTKIFGYTVPEAPDTWQEQHGATQPLFWQEGRPISFYLAILGELKVTAVMDLTAGSGALLEACLTRGVMYHGVALNKEHMAWLGAIADRAACGLITIQGSTLYNAELAETVAKYFSDLLKELVPDEKGDEEEEKYEPDSE